MSNYQLKVLEFDREYPKDLLKLHNGYPVAPDNIKVKKEMLSNYQLEVADFYYILIGYVKKWLPDILIKKTMCFIIKTCNFT